MGPRFVPPAAALAALLAALTAAAPAPSAGTTKRVELIVGFKRNVATTAQAGVLNTLGAQTEERFRSIRARVVSVPAGQLNRIRAALERDPRVRYAEPNVRFHTDASPDDPSFPQLWGLHNTGQAVQGVSGTSDADIDAPEAWEHSTGSAGVAVGVIDTGIDYTHPDLAANIWVNPGENCSGCRNDGIDNDGNGYVDDWHGWDFLNDDNDPFDDNGHGTHVAGTIGAVGGNGKGVTGVNWSVRLMPLKFLGADGSGDAADAVRAELDGRRRDERLLGRRRLLAGARGRDRLREPARLPVRRSRRQQLFGQRRRGELPLELRPSERDRGRSDGQPRCTLLVLELRPAQRRPRGARLEHPLHLARRELQVPGRDVDGTPHVTGAVALVKAAFPNATSFGLKALLLRTVDPNAALATKTVSGGRLNVGNALGCDGQPQVWLEAPAPGFAVDVGTSVDVVALAGACGDPSGADASVTVNGEAVTLTTDGDGLYTGSFVAGEAGALEVTATATSGAATDSVSVSGAASTVYPIVAGGAPVEVTSAGDTVRLAFDGQAGQRVSLKLTNVTIGTSGCCSSKVSIVGPTGATILSPTYFGTSGGFVDTKTLPLTGTYRILLDPQGTATGGATVTLYDVPPDTLESIEPGGDPVTATTTVPGQNARLVFSGVAGRQVSVKLTDVTIGSSGSASAKISILKPDGSTLVGATYFGTSGGFLDAKVLPVSGAYAIVLDPQSNAVGNATVTLYDVPPDVTVSIVPGGPAVSVETTTPGQDAYLTFDGVAGRRVSVKLANVTFGTSCCTSAKISILKPDGSTLVGATYFGTSGGFLDVKTLPVSGAYRIFLDPQSNLTGSATVTLYDVPPDATGSVTVGGAATAVSLGVPGQNARLTFTGTAGQRVTLKLAGVTFGSSCCTSAQVSVLNPSGTTLLSSTYFGTSGKTVALTLGSTGTYTIVLDPQGNATGSANVALTSS